MTIRKATVDDLDQIDLLEQSSFSSDQIRRASMLRLLKKGNCLVLVEEEKSIIHGYVLLLFRRGVSLGRLYSIAVKQEYRKLGVADRLVIRAEEESRKLGIYAIRLEIRKDNTASKRLFEKNGYSQFGEYEDYYEDHMDAVRLHKVIDDGIHPKLTKVPFYRQTLEFTCGPASLMMAAKSLNSSLKINRSLELHLWRQTTTIFMTSGHGGCHPFGLGLAAFKLGFKAEIYIQPLHNFLIDSVRSTEKKEVMKLVESDFIKEIKQNKIPLYNKAFSIEDLEKKFNEGSIPITLISSYKMYKEKSPHWVVITGFSKNYVFVNDAYVDAKKHKDEMDGINIPIVRSNFKNMLIYGKNKHRTVIYISKNEA